MSRSRAVRPRSPAPAEPGYPEHPEAQLAGGDTPTTEATAIARVWPHRGEAKVSSGPGWRGRR